MFRLDTNQIFQHVQDLSNHLLLCDGDIDGDDVVSFTPGASKLSD
jgi:hypothetical protein